ncbi:MAG: membrane protein insertase YidC [Candidatus Berkiellales bacterium]
MDFQRIRLFLVVALFGVGIALYGEWQREHIAPVTPTKTATPPTEEIKAGEIPSVESTALSAATISNSAAATPASQLIHVDTDVFKIQIDPVGGDIIRAELIKYPKTIQSPLPGDVLLERNPGSDFIAQTGLIGRDELGPDSRKLGRAHYAVKQLEYHLGNAKQLDVDLYWNHQDVEVIKTYRFTEGSYLVAVDYRITNKSTSPWSGSLYGQLHREFIKKSSGILGVQMYQGGAVYTPEKPYKKISFSDMKKNNFKEQIEGGWTALLEHYFLCAFIPPKESLNHYYTRVDSENVYNIGATTAIEVAPKSNLVVTEQLYIGPKLADNLKAISKGLNLTIDYGILWPISLVLFWLLKNVNTFVGNWGWSIILVTLIIKILFYKLSAASYRSMGQMRLLQPKIETLKQRHGDNKQQFSAALMEMYKKEKINPLGGCLPILIQIPVFIALYYVLLESIELRHAPFVFWIKDLSSRDPYYVLPLIMGATMFFQQRMNPAPPDPVQAKVMMLMPVIFTVLFLAFPSGLVLYWTANNILSMLQQWYITRSIGNERAVSKVK